MRVASFVLFLFFSINIITVKAQDDKLGGWHIANINYHVSKSISLYGEVQARSQSLTKDFYYHELKAGIAYNKLQKYLFFFGLGDYVTYTYPGNFKSPASVKEFRMWEQIILVNNINRVKIEHRYRVEQRWLNGEYHNRFRYRLNPIIPLNHKTVTAQTWFISAFDEVFFTDEKPYFLRNRAFGGVGYQFTKQFAFQFGFIRQFDYRTTDGGSGKNFLQTSFLFNVDHTNTQRELHPSNMD